MTELIAIVIPEVTKSVIFTLVMISALPRLSRLAPDKPYFLRLVINENSFYFAHLT